MLKTFDRIFYFVIFISISRSMFFFFCRVFKPGLKLLLIRVIDVVFLTVFSIAFQKYFKGDIFNKYLMTLHSLYLSRSYHNSVFNDTWLSVWRFITTHLNINYTYKLFKKSHDSGAIHSNRMFNFAQHFCFKVWSILNTVLQSDRPWMMV